MKRVGSVLLAVATCVGIAGCGAPMVSSPSLTLMSRGITDASPGIKVIGDEVKASDTIQWCLIFGMFGTMRPSHEAVAQRILEEHHADLLVDAQMENSVFGIPYIYMQISATVRGRPAVFLKEDKP